MVPKSDIERFIQAIIYDGDAPFAAKCRIEQYLTDILEERVSTLKPAFRIEYYLAKISGANVELPEPISRADLYLAALAGEEVTLPDSPNSSLEVYLARWCETGNAVSAITGDPASFTGRTNTEIQSISVDLQPIQSLNGYSSPWPAGGGVSKCPSFANGTHTMTNGLTVTIQDGEITINGTASGYGYYEEAIESTVMPADAYVSFNNPVGTFNIAYVFINGNTQIAAPSTAPANATKQPTGLSGATVNKLRIFCNAATYDNFKMSPIVHDGSTPQAWQPYANICPISGRTGANVYVSPTTAQADATTYAVDWISEAGTVYGGTLDVVSGVLTVDRANIPSYNGETITEPWLSSMDEYTPGATPTTGAQVVYKLATPLIYQLTPQEVKSLLGVNNIWSDSGDVTVTLKGGFTD